MRLRKEVHIIKEKIDKLTDETINKAKAYDELKSYLKHINIDVKNTVLTFDTDAMCYCIQVNYDIKPIKIFLDKDNNIVRNETFIAINTLDLISLSDMAKISSKIEEAKEMNIKR